MYCHCNEIIEKARAERNAYIRALFAGFFRALNLRRAGRVANG